MEYIAYGPPDLEANVTALNTTETQVLRCNTLDSVCFTSVLGKRVPNYLLSTCSQRALLLSPKLPKYTYILALAPGGCTPVKTHRSVYRSVPT